MKLVLLAAASLALLPFATVQAQTLEQSYAEQCSSGQTSESCDVLRKALLEKLQSQQAGASQNQANTVLRQAPSEPVAYELTDEQKAQWGLLANLAGNHWLDNDGHISTYEWLEVGERLKLEVEKSTGEKTLQHFRPSGEQAGELAWSIYIPERGGMVRLGQVTVFDDGAIYWRPGNVLWEMADARMTTARKAKVKKDRTYTKSDGVRGTTRQISHAEFEQMIAARDERLRQEALARNSNSGGGSNLMGAALGGLMKGWSEGTAANDAMEQTLRDAVNDGLATGAAQYAREQELIADEEAQQRRDAAEHARRVREQEDSARQARLAAAEAQQRLEQDIHRANVAGTSTRSATLNQPETRSETSSLPSNERDRIYEVRSNMFSDQQRARDWLMSLPGSAEFFDVRCDPIVIPSGETKWICSASQRRRAPGGSGSAQ